MHHACAGRGCKGARAPAPAAARAHLPSLFVLQTPQIFNQRPPGVTLNMTTYEISGLKCGMVGDATYKAGGRGRGIGCRAHALAHSRAALWGRAQQGGRVGGGGAPCAPPRPAVLTPLACRVDLPPTRSPPCAFSALQIKALAPLQISGMNVKVPVPTTVGPYELWLIADSECKTGQLPTANWGPYAVRDTATADLLQENFAPCECVLGLDGWMRHSCHGTMVDGGRKAEVRAGDRRLGLAGCLAGWVAYRGFGQACGQAGGAQGGGHGERGRRMRRPLRPLRCSLCSLSGSSHFALCGGSESRGTLEGAPVPTPRYLPCLTPTRRGLERLHRLGRAAFECGPHHPHRAAPRQGVHQRGQQG